MTVAPGAAAKARRRAAAAAAAEPDTARDLVSTRISERGPCPRSPPAGRNVAADRNVAAGWNKAADRNNAADRKVASRERASFGQQGRRAAATAPSTASIPRHVRNCQEGGSKRWALYLWLKNNPSSVLRVPYRCNSWRHAGPCARHEAAVTFARIKEATEKPEFRPEGFIFVVLTIDRNGFYSKGKPRFADAIEAYKELSRMSRAFFSRLRRMCERRGWLSPKSNWVAVVEAHRSGWAHVNFMIYAPDLAAALDADREARLAAGKSNREAILIDDELLSIAVGAGWGPQSTAERVRSRDALAGYITKIAANAEATSGELAKLTQVPLNAPNKFRRLRSGKGFLPPRRKNLEMTGTLIRREYDPYRSAMGAVALHEINDPDSRRIAMECCGHEADRMADEERIRRGGAFAKGNLPPSAFELPAVVRYPLRRVGADESFVDWEL